MSSVKTSQPVFSFLSTLPSAPCLLRYAASPAARAPSVIHAEPLIQLNLSVGAPVEIGAIDGIVRRYIPIEGGTVSGAYRGTVLPGGADWQIVRRDGSLDLDAHYVLELMEGRVEVESRGIRTASPAVLAILASGEVVDPSHYYFRTFIRFRTASERLSRLNRILAIARGERLVDQVRLTICEVE